MFFYRQTETSTSLPVRHAPPAFARFTPLKSISIEGCSCVPEEASFHAGEMGPQGTPA